MIPDGDLVRSRVVPDARTVLEDALDRRHTGYAVLAAALAGDAKAVFTFEDGVPVLAYHTRTDAGGPAALGAVPTPGPYRLDLYELPEPALATAHAVDELCVPPGAPAERLAGAPALAERTRRRAPDERLRGGDSDGERSAVAAFLEDEERIAELRDQARAEAERRAAEWGFADAVDSGTPPSGTDGPDVPPPDGPDASSPDG